MNTSHITTAKAVLTANIVVNKDLLNEAGDGVNPEATTLAWTPIGTYSYKFAGTFDGNGHTVSGLYFYNTNSRDYATTNGGGNYIGLIGYANGATIQNVGLVDSYLYGYKYIGGICGSSGFTTPYTTITNCYNTSYIKGYNYYEGGILGYGSADISNCYNAGTISGSKYCYSICGEKYGGTYSNNYYLEGKVTDSYATALTDEQFASGEAAFLLNGSTNDNPAWYQTIGEDAYPVLKGAGSNQVYASGHVKCSGTPKGELTYSNTSGTLVVDEHSYNGDICPVCGLIKDGHELTTITEGTYSGYYNIATPADLYLFAKLVNDDHITTAKAVLTANIVVNKDLLNEAGDGVNPEATTLAWTPIGTYSYPFAGTFDGNGHTVSGLYFYNTTAKDYPNGGYNIGLIGRANGATIQNVGVVDSYLYGYGDIGGICGYSYNNTPYTTITNCYNTSYIKGSGSHEGGILGYGYANISNCYNAGTISGSGNCHSICGYLYDGTYSNNYYLSGKASDDNATALTDAQFASGEAAFLLNGSTNDNPAWYQTIGEDAYPVLKGAGSNQVYASGYVKCNKMPDERTAFSNSPGGTLVVDDHEYDESGICTKCGASMPATLITEANLSDYASEGLTAEHIGYYAIGNAGQLYGFASLVNDSCNTTANAVLVADIVVNKDLLNDAGDGVNSGATTKSWTPIGTSSYMFAGTFDGNGHTVSGLYFYNTNSRDYATTNGGGSNIGLIGCASGATIQNVGLVDSYLYGYEYIGGICGSSYNNTPYTTITNCYNTSYIKGSYWYEGGILGYGYAVISNCYNAGTISGSNSYYYHSIYGNNWADTYSNIYYLEGKASDSNAKGLTAAQFASGEAAFLLNGSTNDNPAWYQTIGEDAYPVLKGAGSNQVYASGSLYCSRKPKGELTYSNTPGGTLVVDDHQYDELGYCTKCGAEIMPLTQITEANLTDYEGLTADYIGYYAISYACQLYDFASLVNDSLNTTAKAVLTADIVVNKDLLNDAGDGLNPDATTKEWTPIGKSSYKFAGTFDGNGHTVSGLYFYNTTSNYYPNGGDYIGLIGYASGATITNVGLVDSYLYGYNSIGGICGGSYPNTSTITNCYNTSCIKGYKQYEGGILGTGSADISNCYNAGTISGSNYYLSICGIKQGGTYSNNYYLSTKASDKNATKLTAAQFASGEAASLLNGANGSAWHQNLFADAYPVLDTTHNKVSGYVTEANNVITVTDSLVLAADYVVAAGKTLKIPAGASVTTTGTAVITNNGTILCNGDIYGNNLAGSGTFKTEKLVDADITLVTASVQYKGADYTLENGLTATINANRTICGKAFAIDKSAYTVSYENNRNVSDTCKVIWTGPYSTISKTFSITKKDLALSNFTASNKTYDGTTTATNGKFSDNRETGDDLTFTYNYAFADKNAGDSKTVNFSNIAISGGDDAGNYNLVTTSGTATADIAVKPITVAIASVSNKVYDGNKTAEGTITKTGIVEGDDVTVSHTATFADKNVGTGKTVTFNYTKSGADAGNYVFAAESGTTTANITAKTITVTIASVSNKIYDGNKTAEGTITKTGIVEGDDVTVSHTAAFADKNVGTGKTVTFSYTKSGADAGNYVFASATGTKTASITAKTITVTIASVSNKIYDGNATADGEIEEITDIVEGDDVTVSYPATFADKNVGTGKTVTFSYTKSGADAGNYVFAAESGTTTANITAKTITVTIASVSNKIYDGNKTAEGTITKTGIVEGDDVTVSHTAAFADKNVGTGKTVTFSYTKSGADAGNYVFAAESGTTTANITAKTITVTIASVSNKIYDGNKTAEGTIGTTDIVSGDDVTLSYTATFADKNVGTGKTVTFSYTKSGADAGNYNLATTSATAKADINAVAEEVVVTIALKDKTVMYNGAEQTYKYEESLETASSNSLYAVSFDNISATAQPEVKGTNVGEYAFGWKSTDFSNINTNFSNVRFDVTDAKLTIKPYIYAEVYVTENSDNVVYDSTEHVVSGYMLAIADTTGMLAESDITFSGDSIVKATAAGVYEMNLLASDFANTNANFSNVKFNIVDGQLTISKAAEPGTMPEASIETYYIKTHFIALPANWAWAEDADLNIGSNSAVANYVGADAGNYVKESQTVSINRVACPHSEGSVVYDSLPATCTHRGYTGNLSCKLCGEIYEMGDSTEMLPHTPVTDAAVAATCHSTGLSEGSHCSVCNTVLVAQVETAKIAHTPVVDAAVAATCTATGLSEGSHCSVCDSLLAAQVELPALGHKIEIMASVSATCSATGLTEGQRCSVCGDTLVAQEIIPMLPHTIMVMAGVSPTCTATGLTEGKKCSVCGEIIVAQEVIPALGHTIVVDAAVAATCTEEGLTEGSHCSVCGEVIKAQETIPALGHSFTNYIYNNDATFDADGTETAECDHGCGETHTRTAEGTKLETAIDAAAADEVVIYAHHNVIVVENAVSEIRIYDVTGRCVAICGNEKIDKVRTEIAMEGQGLYIVKSGDTVKRVVLK